LPVGPAELLNRLVLTPQRTRLASSGRLQLRGGFDFFLRVDASAVEAGAAEDAQSSNKAHSPSYPHQRAFLFASSHFSDSGEHTFSRLIFVSQEAAEKISVPAKSGARSNNKLRLNDFKRSSL
jgi:hypothetical protein